MAANSPAETALVILYYLYPALVFIYFFFASLVSACTVHSPDKDERKKKCPNRRLTLVFYLLCILTYTTQLLLLGARAVLSQNWPTEDHIIIGHLACILAFGIQLSRCLDTEEGPFYPFIGSWLLGLSFDIAITVLSAISGLFSPFDIFSILASVSISIRCLSFISLASLFAAGFSVKLKSDEEQEPLLPKVTTTSPDSPTSRESGYGSTLQREAKEAMKKRLEEGGNWFEYAKGFKILFPYVWPVGNVGLQLRAAAVCLCLFASNALHLLIPRQTGIIMDSLNGFGNSNPWISVLVFAALRLAASESGIELMRQWLWVPVKYYSHDALTRAAYSHMMNLSADFHDSKSSSDMMMAIYGGSAVSNVIENVLLYAVPMLIDMGVAIVYLSITFGPYEGLITVATGVFFLLIASKLVANSKTASRNRVNALYEEHYVRQSGFLGWQTVSAFNQIGYEDNRHANAVTNRWLREQQYVLGWYISIGFQTLVLTSGLLASAFLAVYRIRAGHATSGQFAMLLMYWAQLTSPLQFFAKLGKNVSDDFIDAERLLDIMRTQPSVENQKGARPLKFVAGEVDFERVSFSYDKKKGIIKNVSFHVPAGQTVAFVGATGAGKSTLIKLLDRFYDVGDGRICIDGQDIRDVDLFSLRDRIGVVPQNPILFDDTIMNNVRYGRITATDEEVFEACQAACIHDKIKGFTHGYKTRVGERGVKLSGGELQRIAIARAMLKKPDIVLLDEATSAVDTDTEQQIQISFKRLCQGRTTFIVAHRLSTIMNADRIIVVENGEILEQGNHDELIVAGGRYADLWSKQVFVRTKEEDADVSAGQAGFGTRLNPVAATFTPRRLAKIRKSMETRTSEASTSSAAQDGLINISSQTSRQWSDEEGRTITSSGDTTTPATDSSEKRRAFIAAVGPLVKGGDEAEGETKKRDVAESQIFEYKLPYYSRRAQSKSEPSQASQGSDGADVDNELLLSSTGKQMSPHRRVTLPPMKTSTGSQIPVATEHNQALSSASRAVKVQDSTIDRCSDKQSAEQKAQPTMPGRSATCLSSNYKDPQGEDGVTAGTNTTDGVKHGSNEISEPRENPISSTPRRRGRGGRRGRPTWYRGRRGRRGRGSYRGSPQGRQAA
ncbi:AAA ATPase domain [Fusarium oxysporum f. sp. vasinfectum]|nr:AAA ATPase domain [Fusarium oxysporum f. sp. vasinfectum]